MQVQQIMTRNVAACIAGTNLAAVTELLWKYDVGALPVVDADGKLVGIVTDRDIAIALGTRDIAASGVLVDDVMTREVWTCRPSDDLPDALKLLADAQIRRAPVVDEEGRLCGIVTVNDIGRHTGSGKQDASRTDVLSTLLTICAPNADQAAAANA